MTKHRAIGIIIALGMLVFNGVMTAFAKESYGACVQQNNGTNVGYDVCAQKSETRWDAMMKLQYNKLMAILSQKDRHLLRMEQRNWLQFRKYRCAADGHIMYAGGADEDIDVSYCLRKTLIDRAKALAALAQSAKKRVIPYYNDSKVYADTGTGKGFLLGNTQVCVVVNNLAKTIRVEAQLSWTGHLLDTGFVPFTSRRGGRLVFRFRDGWGNVGAGSVTEGQRTGLLSLQVVRKAGGKAALGDFDLDDYGKYKITQGPCKTY